MRPPKDIHVCLSLDQTIEEQVHNFDVTIGGGSL